MFANLNSPPRDRKKELASTLLAGLISLGVAFAQETEPLCSRYEQFSFEQIMAGQDPWARICLFSNEPDPRLAEADKRAAALTRIRSEYEFGNDQIARQLAEEWIEQYSSAPTELATKVYAYLALSAYELGGLELAKSAAQKVLEYAAIESNTPDHFIIRYWEALAAIADLPRTALSGPGSEVRTKTSSKGQTKATLSVSGSSISALIDTGAEMSVISADLVQQLGFRTVPDIRLPMRYLFGETEYSPIAVAPPIRLGDTVIENAIFLVVDPNNMPARANEMVLGLPFLKALGRIAFFDRGKWLAFGDSAPAVACVGGTGRLFRHKDGVGLSTRLGGDLAPAQFDSGFTGVYGYDGPLRYYAPDLRFHRWRKGERKIGRSPLVTGEIRNLPFEWDEAILTAHGIPVFRTDKDESPLQIPLVVGGWATKNLDLLVLDFETMTYAARRNMTDDVRHCLLQAD